MGITGFYNFFKDASTTKYISELRGSIVVVDISGVLVRFGIGIRNQGHDKKNKHGKVINHLYAIVKYTMNLLEKGIFPYYVFDGKSSLNKVAVSCRKRNKLVSIARCELITDKTSSEFIKYFKRGYSFSRSDIEECKKLLEYMGIPYIHAPEEADSQCAVIAHTFPDLVAGVVTDDSDILIYGCPKIYKEFNPKTSTMVEYNYINILEIFHKEINNILNDMGQPLITYNYTFLSEKLRQFCILMGSDYGKLVTIKSNSDKNYILLKLFVECNFDIMQLVKTIKMNNASSGKCIYYISENIVEEFHKVDSEYKDSQVLVPDKSTIIIKPPMKDMLADFLTDVMDYNNKEITTIIDTITNNYLVFRKMRQLDTNNNGRVCGDFNAFLTYRYRYCKKNIFQTHKKYENTPVVYGNHKTNNRWKCDDPVCSPTDIRVYG